MPRIDNTKQRAQERIAHRNAERTKRANEAMKQGPAEELDPGIAALRERRRAKAAKAAEKFAAQGLTIDGVPRPNLRITLPPRRADEEPPEELEEGEVVEGEEGSARRPKRSKRKSTSKRR